MDRKAEGKKTASTRHYEEVIEGIKAMISSGILKEGEKLPSERDLAGRFSVSRGPVREALMILEHTGVILNNGKGFYVAQGDSMRNDTFGIKELTGSELDMARDLIELRVALETTAAYYAAQRRTQEDIVNLQNSIQGMRDAKRANSMDGSQLEEIRYQSHMFHMFIVSASKNRMIKKIYNELFDILDETKAKSIRDETSYNIILAHEAICDKIIMKDSEGARQRMEEHLEATQQSLLRRLGD